MTPYQRRKKQAEEAAERDNALKLERQEERRAIGSIEAALAASGLNVATNMRVDGMSVDLTVGDKPAPAAPPPLLRYMTVQGSGMSLHYVAAEGFYGDPKKYAQGMVQVAGKISTVKEVAQKERRRALERTVSSKKDPRTVARERAAEKRSGRDLATGSVRPISPAAAPSRIEPSLRRNKPPRR